MSTKLTLSVGGGRGHGEAAQGCRRGASSCIPPTGVRSYRPGPRPGEDPRQGDRGAPLPGRRRAARTREGGCADYFLRSSGNTLEWIYHDRLTRRWYRQGWIE